MHCFPHICAAECGLAFVFLQINNNHGRTRLLLDLISSPNSKIKFYVYGFHIKMSNNKFGSPPKTQKGIRKNYQLFRNYTEDEKKEN